MTTGTQAPDSGLDRFRQDFGEFWNQIPYKLLFGGLLLAWLALFHFLGNSTLGYINTSSLFGWLNWVYSSSTDDEHGYLIPLVVLALLWWKRKELIAIPKKNWWPALLLVGLGLAIHIFGYMIQQARISVIGFFVGLYGLTGLTWGPQWLRASFFPFFLFAFCLPLSGGPSEKITFPLRLVATKITAVLSHTALGINVIQDGTRIFDANGSYQYEVAVACSGIRSLTATLALSVIYGFVAFKSGWKRLFMAASAFPLAVAANVVRLTAIIIAAEAFGQEAGNFVHHNFWLSLLPYVPAIGGIFFVGYWLRRNKVPRVTVQQSLLSGAEQKS